MFRSHKMLLQHLNLPLLKSDHSPETLGWNNVIYLVGNYGCGIPLKVRTTSVSATLFPRFLSRKSQCKCLLDHFLSFSHLSKRKLMIQKVSQRSTFIISPPSQELFTEMPNVITPTTRGYATWWDQKVLQLGYNQTSDSDLSTFCLGHLSSLARSADQAL